MNTFSFGVSVFLKGEQQKKYKYGTAEEAEIKIMRKKRNEICVHSEASIFYVKGNMH